jgi:two-component system, sensor histidine kinase and response regulator
MKNKAEEQFLDVVTTFIQRVAGGDYTARMELYNKNDTLDAIITGLNMLVEELEAREKEKEITISKLNESEATIRAISGSAQDAIIMIDNKGKISYWNKSAQKIFGYTARETMREDLHNLLAPSKYHESIKAGFDNFKKTGKGAAIGKTVELEGVHKSGKIFPLALSLSTVKIKGEWNALGIVRDITEQKRNIEELKKSKETAEAANVAKDKFFSIISHDLKGSFSSIFGFVNLMTRARDILSDEEIDRLIKEMYRVGEASHKLLENLLEWAQSQTGRIQVKLEELNLQILVREIIEFSSSQAKHKEICLTSNVSTNAIVLGDKKMIQTVIRNLIANAIKFTPKNGKIDIVTEIKDSSMEITVSDTGVGISPKKIDQLFRIDTQVTSEGTENEKGSGLGLILCKEFVYKNHGKIWVESETGKGTKVKFTLPIVK